MAGSSHRPHQPAAARLFLLFIVSVFVSQVFSDCFFPNGKLANGMSECRKDGKGTGICCFDGDGCVGRICSHDTSRNDDQLYRGACISEDWTKDGRCPDICSGKDNLQDKFEDISPCPQEDEYWCGSWEKEKDGCDPKHRVELKGRPGDPLQRDTHTLIPPRDRPPRSIRHS